MKLHTPVLPFTYQQFDQTPGQGWRALVEVKQFVEAARMIEGYLVTQPHLTYANRVNLHFHAAQCLAFAGDAKSILEALEHLKASRLANETSDSLLWWNDYVAATEAFLQGDAVALNSARERIANVPGLNGKSVSLNVVDGLVANIGKSYAEAYGARHEQVPLVKVL